MMQQQTAQTQLKRLDIFFHAFKTFKLVGVLLFDRRVPILRKFAFLGSVVFLLVLLFFPDLIGETILSTILPVIGTIIGVPIDIGMDWIAFALLIVNFLHFFPEDIVAEHYRQIFG